MIQMSCFTRVCVENTSWYIISLCLSWSGGVGGLGGRGAPRGGSRAYPPPRVYLLVQSTTCSSRNRPKRGIFNWLLHILSFVKIQIFVHISSFWHIIFIVMINQMHLSVVDMSETAFEHLITKLLIHTIHLYTLLKWIYWGYDKSST